jgi:acyl-[acyl-carrier-protein] desaturase
MSQLVYVVEELSSLTQQPSALIDALVNLLLTLFSNPLSPPCFLYFYPLPTEPTHNTMVSSSIISQAKPHPVAANRTAVNASIVCQAQPHPTAANNRKTVKTSAAVLDRTSGPTIVNTEVIRMHTASKEALECIDSLQPMFGEEILPLLLPVDDIWQPQDFLPAPEKESFLHDLADLRERAAELPDELLVCLVGDMITEEALPTYMAMLNTLDGVRDETGRSQDPYAQWTRQWIAEENRHGDLLNKYLWCTGRVDLRSVERTIQRLISSGMDPQTSNDAYLCFVFTSFQERATKLSHGSTARIAKQCGNDNLAKICGVIAQDESRHEAAYTRTMDAIFKKDPSRAMIAFADMMRKKIIMPAAFMDDGRHADLNGGRNLFDDFSMVAEDIGVYTALDYVKIMEHLIRRWDVPNVTGLNAEAMQAQEYLCNLPQRFRKLAERREKRKVAGSRLNVKFSWLHDREVSMPDFGANKERLKRAAAPPSLIHS